MMGPHRALLAILVAVPLAIGSAQAETREDLLAVELDADEVLLRIVETVSGIDAQDLRSEVDVDFGNDDGKVEQAELDLYHQMHQASFRTNRPSCFSNFEFVHLDGARPLRISEMRTHVEGALGSVRSMDAMRVERTLLFQFPAPANEAVEARIRFAELWSLGVAVGCYAMDSTSWQWTWNRGSSSPCCTMEAGPGSREARAQSTAYAPGGEYWIHPYGDAHFAREDVDPARIRALWDGRGIQADTRTERDEVAASDVRIRVQGGGPGPTFDLGSLQGFGAVLGYTTLGIGAVGLAAALGTEHFRYQLLKWLVLVPLFTRLEKDEVLEHDKREELYKFIRANPGPSFSDLRRELELSNGTLVHHLRILEAQEFVKSVRDGFRTRFYIRGPKIVQTSYLTRTQQTLLDAIGGNPGVTQKELSQLLGLPRESVSYHTKRLASQGQLQIRQEGKWRRYFVAPPSGDPASARSGAP